METLNPRVRLAWAIGAVVTAAILGVGAAAIDRFVLGVGLWVALAVAGLALALGLVFVVLRYRVWRFAVRDDDLYLERGVLTRVNTVVPSTLSADRSSARSACRASWCTPPARAVLT